MKYTKIQWCHSTINPEMGCDGCELWKSAAAIAAIMLTMLILLTKKPKATLRQAIARAVGDRKTSELYRDRERVKSQASAVLTAISHSAFVRAASSGHSQQRWTRILVHLHV